MSESTSWVAGQGRLLCGLAIAACLGTACMGVYAANPTSGTLTPDSGPVEYDAGPFTTSNPTPEPSGQLDAGPECALPGQSCDSFNLTVALPAGFTSTYPNAHVQVTMSWTDGGVGASDYDLYVYQGADFVPDGSQTAYSQSATGANPEQTTYFATAGTRQYSIIVVPYTATGEMPHVKVELLPGDPGATGNPNLADADPAAAGVPRYQQFIPPDGSPANSSQGEFNIGFDPNTGRIMTMNSGPILRVTPPERLTPASPESCPALWEDVSSTITDTGLDPILWTDQTSGRTFASNSTAGANAAYAWSDDDGDTWIPVSASPPNGGADHQTIGSGPYPPNSPFAAVAAAAGFPNAVYYCSQSGTGSASCQRSDDGGASYGPGVVAYDGVTSSCSGLHGHIRVSPSDGAAYVPVPNCGDHIGGVVSTDAGTTWTEFAIPNSSPELPDGSDPSVGLASDGTAYFCYINAEADGTHHPHVAVSHDHGQTWVNDFDIGAVKGIENADFPQAWAGDPDRAACGFIGTDRKGNSKALDFPGIWYAFIATTYDGGKTWTTVNATPHDPVQGAGGIWNQGGSAVNRNQLDFNEATADDKGYFLYGYDDGCVSQTCIADPTQNDFVGYMRVIRQTGGKPLFAAHDPVEPAAPKAACLAGMRDQYGTYLQWVTPDHGGAAISGYKIYRGTSANSIGSTPVGTAGAKNTFVDQTADSSVTDYFYKVVAVNAQGDGVGSNVIDLKVTPHVIQDPCVLPGVEEATSPTGNASPNQPYWDLESLHLAEPSDQDGKLVFTLKVADLSSVPPGTRWSIRFTTTNPPANGDDDYFVMMTTESSATPQFVYGTTGAGAAPARLYTQLGTLDAASTYDPDGTITLVLDKSDIPDLQVPGSLVKGLLTQTRAVLTPQNAAIYDTMGGSSVYTLKTACGPIDGVPASGRTGHGGGAMSLAWLLSMFAVAGLRRRLRGDCRSRTKPGVLV